jgi:(1->4)-alpha-D-glucan 1-alpha-D-glucosylmutase
LIEAVAGASGPELADSWRDGREKLFIIQRLLGLRQSYPALFAEGDYRPLAAEGGNSAHLCAFARSRGEEGLVVAVPRLVYRLYRDGSAADWGAAEIALPPGGWRDAFTGRKLDEGIVPVSRLLADFPVAVLRGENGA